MGNGAVGNNIGGYKEKKYGPCMAFKKCDI